MWARRWRAQGWLCIFRNGQVIIAPRDPAGRPDALSAFIQPVNAGDWSLAVDERKPPWRPLSPSEVLSLAPLLTAIARDCYCSQLHCQTGCDFCQNTRLPDGAKEN